VDKLFDILGQISVPTLAVTLVPAFFVARWQAASQFKTLRKSEFYKQKHELYKRAVDVLHKIVRDRDLSDETIQKLRDINSEILLVGSRKVVQAMGDFFVTVYVFDASDNEVDKRFGALLGEVIRNMRIDLGLDSRWRLFKRFSWYDSLRVHFNDLYDIHPRLPLSRGVYVGMRLRGVKSPKKLPRKP
jgi:hypothetical protein